MMKEEKPVTKKKILTYGVIVGLALLSAVNYQLFVFPNKFAPAGLNGLCTMIQYVLGINVGYMNLIINIPLAIIVYRTVSKVIATRSMVYVVSFSLALIMLEHTDLSTFAYATENGTSTILGPLVAGIINGACYSMLIKACSSTGGTDFVATLVPGKGMYSGHETNILVCIINKTQIPVLGSIIRSYPNTFAVMSSVTEVMGNFKHMNTDGTESNIFLDSGDGSEV